MSEAITLEEVQPTHQSTVWQGNQLSIAQYRASETEQKLLFYAIAMVDNAREDFARYRIHVATFAKACGVNPNSLYTDLRAAAESIAEKPLIVTGHRADDGQMVDLITHWFAEVECGDGYIDVSFPPSLKKHLLVQRNFFQYALGIALQFRGEYAIRLYQWAKRWKFTGHSKLLNVSELRSILGLRELNKQGVIVSERLRKYGDMKKWALQPALVEIERASDILVRMKEIKKPKMKLVQSIEFSIFDNPQYSAPAKPKMLNTAEALNPEQESLLADLCDGFGLTAKQAHDALEKNSFEELREVSAIVRSKARDNAAATFITALRDKWKPPKKIVSSNPVKQAAVAAPVKPQQTDEQVAANRPLFAAMKQKLQGGPPRDENQNNRGNETRKSWREEHLAAIRQNFKGIPQENVNTPKQDSVTTAEDDE